QTECLEGDPVELSDTSRVGDPKILLFIKLKVGDDVAEESVQGSVNNKFAPVKSRQPSSMGPDPQVAILVFQHDVDLRLRQPVNRLVISKGIDLLTQKA